MKDQRQYDSVCTVTLRKPRVVLACGAAGGAAGRVAEELRTRDWDVYSVPASADMACAILARRPGVVLLPTQTEWESGYLLAAKLRKAKPKVRVILLARTRTPEAERFAKFVGATLVAEDEGLDRLLEALTG